METASDRNLLVRATGRGWISAEDAKEILAKRQDLEGFLGGPVAVDHVLLQEEWLDEAQVTELQSEGQRRPHLCPRCCSRINVHGVSSSHSFECKECPKQGRRTRVVVPAGPGAVFLVLESSAPAPPSDVPTQRVHSSTAPTTRLPPHHQAVQGHGFSLVREVGRGGSGVVYEARQESLGRLVAIKVLHHSMAGDTEMLRRFYREASQLARVDHRNVIRIHFAAFSNPAHFIVLEWAPGRTLEAEALLVETHSLPPARVLELALDAAAGLAAIHDRGIVHRDVKPSNILLREDGTAAITDFGLVRTLVPEDGAPLTHTGQVIGTPTYMSPEQYVDPRRASPASDVYSLGATLYDLLSGARPFGADSIVTVFGKLARLETPRLGTLDHVLPAAVVELVERMMAPDPANRFRDMHEAIRAMRKVLETMRRAGRGR